MPNDNKFKKIIFITNSRRTINYSRKFDVLKIFKIGTQFFYKLLNVIILH